jgi:hypothetical protein
MLAVAGSQESEVLIVKKARCGRHRISAVHGACGRRGVVSDHISASSMTPYQTQCRNDVMTSASTAAAFCGAGL